MSFSPTAPTSAPEISAQFSTPGLLGCLLCQKAKLNAELTSTHRHSPFMLWAPVHHWRRIPGELRGSSVIAVGGIDLEVSSWWAKTHTKAYFKEEIRLRCMQQNHPPFSTRVRCAFRNSNSAWVSMDTIRYPICLQVFLAPVKVFDVSPK
jgi:hypothetical protein